MAHGQRRRGPRPRRQEARRILVVTEGTVTEPQYVEGLNNYLRSKGSTTTVHPVKVGKDPLRVVDKCIAYRDDAQRKDQGFDECVCLVDVDEHGTLKEAIELARCERIFLIISHLKFEVWLRWHKEEHRSALTSTQLDKRMEELGLVTRKKISHSFPYDKVGFACKIARLADPDLAPGRIGPNPSTAMPLLVDLLSPR